jgi:hypothetical protein
VNQLRWLSDNANEAHSPMAKSHGGLIRTVKLKKLSSLAIQENRIRTQ